MFIIKHHYSNAIKTAYLGHLTIPEFFLILSYEVKSASKKYQLKKPKSYVGYGVDNGSGSENMHLFYISIYDLPPGNAIDLSVSAPNSVIPAKAGMTIFLG